MSQSVPLPSLAATAALYMTRVQSYTIAAGAWEQLLAGDPRRYWVEFKAESAMGAAYMILPAPGQSLPIQLWQSTSPLVYKWTDCPSVVGGQWWVYGTAGAGWIVDGMLLGGGLKRGYGRIPNRSRDGERIATRDRE